jgi:hypothetical protein
VAVLLLPLLGRGPGGGLLFAQNGATGACTWALTDATDNKTLTISGAGAMADYQLYSVPWRGYNTRISTVVIRDGVTRIGDRTFYECRGLREVTIPNSVTAIGEYAFAGCTSLKEVTLPIPVTTIGKYAFAECTDLQEVTLPNAVTTIGEYAFAECIGLTAITLGNAVTTIGMRAFSWCPVLTEVTIPASVTTIGREAFSDCASLTAVTNLNPTPQAIDSNVFSGTSTTSGTLWVPAAAVAAYAQAGWGQYFKTIKPLPED